MTKEDKELVLIDLCARLPYGVKININGKEDTLLELGVDTGWVNASYDIDDVKPYLRSLSSMTEEEEKELEKITPLFNFNRLENIIYVGNRDDGFCFLTEMEEIITFLNAHHFDYRGLIEKGLALEAPEGMYKNY